MKMTCFHWTALSFQVPWAIWLMRSFFRYFKSLIKSSMFLSIQVFSQISILVLTPLFRDALTLQTKWWGSLVVVVRKLAVMGSLAQLPKRIAVGSAVVMGKPAKWSKETSTTPRAWVSNTLGFSCLLEESWGSSNSSSWIALRSPSKNNSRKHLRSTE